MENNYEIAALFKVKEKLDEELSSLTYGSVEIREKKSNKYIYVHFRKDGQLFTKYVGEFTDDLYNLILENNIKAKKIKKEIRDIEKKLKRLEYIKIEVSPDVSENVQFVKSHLPSIIHNQAIFENIAISIEEVKNILANNRVKDVTPGDIIRIVNILRAWDFILSDSVISVKCNFSLLSQINQIVVANSFNGYDVVKKIPNKIGDTAEVFVPPKKSEIEKGINELINKKIDKIDLAIELIVFVIRNRIFVDGNKRTALIFANHYLISNGLGLLDIPANLTIKYKMLLGDYYKTGDASKIISFLKDKCYKKM